MNTSKKQAYAVILSTFVLGALIGALGMNLYGRSVFSSRSNRPAPGKRPPMIDELATEVKLTEPQRVEVQKILDETKQQFDALGKQLRPQFDQIRDHSHTRIKALLSPEQQSLFDEWHRKREARREQMHRDRENKEKAK